MSYDKRFVIDDTPAARNVKYKCAGCGKEYNQMIKHGCSADRCGPPNGMMSVGVEVSAYNGLNRNIFVPVCDNDKCIEKGLRSAFELAQAIALMQAKQ